MADRAEVVVVGAGVMGLATAHTLARAGRDVLVLEQFELGHRLASSHGATRIFRLAYPQPAWVRLAQESLVYWRELEAESETTLVEFPGLLEFVDDLSESSRAGLDACDVAWEELDPLEVERRYSLHMPSDWTALLQPEAGFLRAERALAALRAGAEESGAEIRHAARVESLEELEAEVVIVTAGAWAKQLLGESGIDLPVVVTRETVVYFRLDREEPPPSVVRMIHRGHGFYALADPVCGLKVGHHRSGKPVEDPSLAGEPDPGTVEAASEWARETFALADAEPAAAETCLYTNAPEDRFILERRGRIVVGSACSGHGFKFAPVVGRKLAELAR